MSPNKGGAIEGRGILLKISRAYVIRVNLHLSLMPLILCLLATCSTKTESTSHSSSTKFEQYYVQGEQLYLKNCSNCHQKNGTGLGLLYPPLNKSDYLRNNFEEVICILKKGKEGEILVNGKSFNKAMPGIPSLTDLEVAEIATYVYNSWNNEKGIIEVNDVSRILSLCDSLPGVR